MLRSLHIRNYILIDSLDITFPEGLVIVTGQTGAGKSILLGALSLLCGGKADAGMVGKGAENCVVEAEFQTGEGLRIMRRVVNASGRSRSFIDDCPVQVQELAELGARLVDIHSQHQSLLLTDKGFQLSILDRYAGNTESVAACRACWQSIQAGERELSELEARIRRAAAEMDWNDSQFRELEAAQLREGELEELEEEQKALANAEEIRENLGQAYALLNPDNPEGPSSVAGSVREAGRALDRIVRFLPAMEDLHARLESARMELEDISDSIEDAASHVNLSRERLEEVDERLGLLYSLMKKHGCRNIAELVATRERLSEELFDSSTLESRRSDLLDELKSLRAEHESVCSALHASRCKAAEGFGAEILSSLRFLELERAAFKVAVRECSPGADGADSVQFLFSSDGSTPVDAAKCASGGELSRIMLSLKAMMAHFSGMPTLIFDEIDTGVSGSVADRMGSMICSMGREMQVFSITHLPQVAAKGNAHYLVSKSTDGTSGNTVSHIRRLEGEERVMEVARMLSGSVITPEAVANARALIDS